MNVLWIVNTIFPDLAEHLGRTKPVVGGWMYGLAKDISKSQHTLTVVTAAKGDSIVFAELDNINYYLLPTKSNDNTLLDQTLATHWKEIVPKINPQIIHIHGTEYAHGLSLVKTFPDLNYVASIQGLIGIYSRYFTGQLSISEILRHMTPRDVYKRDGILQEKKRFKKRGKLVENEYFKLIPNIIGRTDWDFAHAKGLNPDCHYYFCNESLRNGFYEGKTWNYESCEPHTIFLSQAGYPLKGLHQVLRALPFLIKKYPNIHIKVAGRNIIKANSLKDRLKLTGYGNFIRKLITKNKLSNHISFLGSLTEDGMIEEYLKCNVFICPSSIENSPNSLGEAQLLGTPCIAAHVGGVANMLTHEHSGILYRFEEVEMLAQHINHVFENPKLATELGGNGKKQALARHDKDVNLTQLTSIYKEITPSDIQ